MRSRHIGLKLGLVVALSTLSVAARRDVDRSPGSTGRVVDVQMVGDAKGFRFSPAIVTVKRGDRVRWTMVSGAPHNVAFWPDSVPAGAAKRLGANMPKSIAPLTGPFLMSTNETYEVSFEGVPKGTYRYFCTPHLALGMKAVVRVE
jgi:plastocyanin